VEKLDISRYVNTDNLPEGDKDLLTQLRKLQESEINKYIAAIPLSPVSGRISSMPKRMICRMKPKS
jgi:hypothetical protein